MAFLKNALRFLFAPAEAIGQRLFGQNNNPFANLGALGWYLFWIAGISGIGLAFLEQSGFIRDVHDLAADILLGVIILHLLRELSLDRMQGSRLFAWVSGAPLLLLAYLAGTTGGVLIWHILAAAVLLALIPLHVRLLAHARIKLPSGLALTITGTLVLLAMLGKLTPQLSAGVGTNQVGPLLLVTTVSIAVAALPWVSRRQPTWLPVVALNNCNGCGRCAADCPFRAISMEPRSDGKPYALEATVNASRCLSCGICTGSCPTATPYRRTSSLVPGIELPQHTISSLRERTLDASGRFTADQRVLVYACEHCGADALGDSDAEVVTMPCVGMLPPSFIDFVLSRKLADGIMIAGCAENDCYFRLGDRWTNLRIDDERDPFLGRRVDRARIETSWLPPGSSARRRSDLQDFRTWLAQLEESEAGEQA